ncbi:hypothetical protein [Allomesorhizobium camelthorni]|uniref:hypothetical protein n=1 Tax=Allomesorhizobium camelthorni TaxID=475069 RepID=UPI00197D7671|nr:hypothetical protein [Mesorhizobium camelthorni]
MAVASGRVSYVFLVKGTLYSWRISRQASKSPAETARMVESWIHQLRPDVVVTETITKHCRKGETTIALIEAVARVATDAPLLDVSVSRPHRYRNKYVEAEALADRFTELRPWVPKPRKSWDSEPRSTTLFEALALALEVIDQRD